MYIFGLLSTVRNCSKALYKLQASFSLINCGNTSFSTPLQTVTDQNNHMQHILMHLYFLNFAVSHMEGLSHHCNKKDTHLLKPTYVYDGNKY
jgi:hypothetical protein